MVCVMRTIVFNVSLDSLKARCPKTVDIDLRFIGFRNKLGFVKHFRVNRKEREVNGIQFLGGKKNKNLFSLLIV